MSAVVHATLIDGVLKPDEPLSLPNGSRVRVSVEKIEPSLAAAPDRFDAFLRYCDQHPVRSDGKKFNREELYDRG